ncbi:MAG: RNHCP domain-containing protein [Candidatus Altimarinota bacterium]
MQEIRSKTIKINHAFTCLKCGKQVPPAEQTCRNHCPFCLYSQHVDDKIPGDRASTCQQLMRPYEIDQNSKKGFQIRHRCTACDKIIINKVASDDSIDEINKIIIFQNLQHS